MHPLAFRSGLEMVPAAAHECDVADVPFEGVQVADACDERVELGGWNVVDPAALVAHKMAVCAREMKERRTVRSVHMFDKSPVVQGVKGPVHGRQMNFWVGGVHPCRQIIGGEMLVRPCEQLDHEPARRRYPPPLRPQHLERPDFLFAHPSGPFRRATRMQLRGVRIWPEVWISQTQCF
jgi:hypothetical protein